MEFSPQSHPRCRGAVLSWCNRLTELCTYATRRLRIEYQAMFGDLDQLERPREEVPVQEEASGGLAEITGMS
jgi:hypothetical protein